MASEEDFVYYGYVTIASLLCYCIFSDIYVYLILLCVLHVGFIQLSKKYVKYIDPKGKAVLITGCDTGR